MWLIFGFAGLGLLIGNLIGLSASSIVPSFIGMLFTLLGGSLIAFLQQISEPDRKLAGRMVCALTASCLLGVYGGIAVNEWALLSPAATSGLKRESAASKEVEKPARNKYLASDLASNARSIDWLKRSGHMTVQEAYDALLAAALENSEEAKNEH